MTNIYIVEQLFEDTRGYPTSEALRAFSVLARAQEFCRRRANVLAWKEHDSHGRSWESLNGDGKYVIVEIGLE